MAREHAPTTDRNKTSDSATRTPQNRGATSAILQRLEQAPQSLRPADILHLQRTIGNRATGQLLQTKLKLGPAGDQYEQEADRVAKQVVRASRQPAVQREEGDEGAIQASPYASSMADYVRSDTPVATGISRVQRGFGARPQMPKVQRDEMEEELQAKPNHGLEGGEVDTDVAQSIQSAKGGGQPLHDGVRSSMERGFGADFSGVNVHTGPKADALNRSLNARAFTTGSDIFFGKGQYNPGSTGGQELIAHELTHTVQQGAASVQRDIVQRDIGFEFETKGIETKRTNLGALPGNAFASPELANQAWSADTTTRIIKGGHLLTQPDVNVEADDVGAQDSDLEVVTTHFPLDNPGRARLDHAMANVILAVNAFTNLGAGADNIVPATALAGVGGFQVGLNDSMMKGKFGKNWAQTTTAGQVTFGIRTKNIGDIVSDLHSDPTESGLEKADRDPGRMRMRAANAQNPNEPKNLSQGNEGNTLVVGHTLAKDTLQQYKLAHATAPGGRELEGLLTIIFAYCESMQFKGSFLKSHTALMAKTNLATIFTTLPQADQDYYSKKKWGKSNFERLVETAPGYAQKMNRPLFYGGAARGNLELADDMDKPNGQQQWYHKLTLKSWLRGIVLRDRTLTELWNEGSDSPKKRRGTDKLTTGAFPSLPQGGEVEGYGALGTNMDTDINTPESLPVFELRSASKMIAYSDARQWALDFFDYIRSVNNNPDGGHTRMN